MAHGHEAVSSNGLLGFAPGARLLIVNADDFGMYGAVNAAVIESIDHGIASSCSLMVPCPASRRAMQLLRLRPDISFGIHLTLVCDTIRDRWGPMAPKARVTSLLDETGELFPPAQVTGLLEQARLDEVELALPRRWRTRRHLRPDGGARQGERPGGPHLARARPAEATRTRATGRR